MLAPGLLLTLGPAVALGKGAIATRLLAAVPGLAALAWPVWFTLDLTRRDRREQALAARAAVLAPVRSPHRASPSRSILALLEADRHTSSFYARSNEMHAMSKWLASGDHPVMIVAGPPQTGKRRLAIEWAEDLPATWIAGWARPARGADVVDGVVAGGDDTVVLMDGFSADLPLLLARVRTRESGVPAIRVVVVTRDADELRARLRREPLAGARDVELGVIGARSDHERWYADLCRHYAAAQDPMVPTVDLPALPQWEPPPIGLIHAAALAAVRRRPTLKHRARSPRRLDMREVMEILWAEEIGAWRDDRKEEAWGLIGLSEAQLEEGVLALSMLSPRADETEAALRRIPELEDAPAGLLRNLVRWVEHMYPAAPGSTRSFDVRPHVIVDAAFVRLGARDDTFARAVLETPIEHQARAVIDRLIHAVPLLPLPEGWLSRAIGRHDERLSQAVRTALLTAPTLGRLDGELSTAAETCGLGANVADELWETIADWSLLETRCVVAWRSAKIARVRAVADPFERATLARALNRLYRALSQAGGQDAAALEVIQEAVALQRELATEDPRRHQPELAGMWVNESRALTQVGGRQEDALRAIEQAVALWRKLASEDPAKYQRELARALNNEFVALAELGDRDHDALHAIEEAVALERRLTAADPGTHKAYLGQALNNEYGALKNVGGRGHEALRAVQEAVALYRELAVENPGRHGARLAMALSNEYSALSEVGGRSDEALRAVQESVSVRRMLVAEHPAPHRDDLAASLNNEYAALVALGGRDEEALRSVNEAVAIYRDLAAEQPSRYRSYLALALTNQSDGLVKLSGLQDEALEATEQALAIYRQLAAEHPAAYRADLARTLTHQGNALHRAHRSEEALPPAGEGVAIYRVLAAAHQARHQPGLVDALINEFQIRDTLGDRRPALLREAVALLRPLADQNPERWGAEYRRWTRRLEEISDSQAS